MSHDLLPLHCKFTLINVGKLFIEKYLHFQILSSKNRNLSESELDTQYDKFIEQVNTMLNLSILMLYSVVQWLNGHGNDYKLG